MQPERIGAYRVIRQIGHGGMGVVYEAMHEQIQHRAAIKVLLPEVSKDADMAARFFNEARAVNIIRHPGIVSVSDLGQLPDGSAYIVMEYLEGESLRTRLARGLLKSSGLRLVRQIAAALAAAHSKGIIHREHCLRLLPVGELRSYSGPRKNGGKRRASRPWGNREFAGRPSC